MRFHLSGRRVPLILIGLFAGALRTEGQTGGPPPGRIYFVSSTGNDLASGLGRLNAWRSIARVNQQLLGPGDSVFFEGGAVFPGTLVLDGEGGTPDRPLTIASYGIGQAVLWGGFNTGVDVTDAAGIHLTNLSVAGTGLSTNGGIGISFYSELPGDVRFASVRIDHCRVTGFRRGGISIGSYNGRTGFDDVRVENCRLDHNGNNGMAVWGFYDPGWGQTPSDYPHRSIYIAHNVFESNWGDPTLTHKHTGSGVEVAQAADVVIEFNLAFDNGRLNSYSGGGPVGIWMWDVLQGVIQHNESHHNTSATIDGGGFDLDGGCVQSLLQYNYSHDNDGPGFMIAQFPNGARPMHDVTARYNISERDGGRGGAGALQLWNGDTAGAPVDTAMFHNNTVFVEGKPVGIPRAFRAFGSGSVTNSGFSNNLFYSRGASAWLGEVIFTLPPLWVGNLYYAESGPFVVRDAAVNYASLLDWRALRGQERLFGQPTGVQGDPLLTDPGNGGTLGDPDALTTLDAYRLLPASVALDRGVPLPLYGIPVGSHDYYDEPVPAGAGYAIGAHEGP